MDVSFSFVKPLLSEHLTIANFSEVATHLNQLDKNQLIVYLKPYKERSKWLSGTANFPLAIFVEFCRTNRISLTNLKYARFSSKGVNSNFRVRLPFEITSKFAYFLGALAGDGYICRPKPNQRSNWVIKMCEDDFDYQKQVYIPLVEELFGASPKLHRSNRKDGRKNFYSDFNSYIAILYLSKVFGVPTGYKANSITIPKVFHPKKNQYKYAYLSGLFDTDGTVTNGRVKFSTVSQKLFEQVKEIMTDAGMKYYTNKWLKNERSNILYTIILPKSSLLDFKKLIGFKNVKKKDKLADLLAPSSSGQG